MDRPTTPEDSPREARHGLVVASGALPILLGVLTLVGWSTGHDVLARGLLSGRVPMVPLTAVGMILAGAAVLVVGSGAGDALRRYVGSGLALVVAAVGAAAVIAVVRAPLFDLGELPLGPRTLAAALPSGAWPAINAGVLFLLTGTALVLCAWPVQRLSLVVRGTAVVTAATAFLALVGHVYGLSELYGLSSFTPMALPTATGFLALAVATAALDPGRWLLDLIDPGHGGGLLAQRLIPAVVIVPLLFGLLALWGARAGLFDITYALSILVVATVVVLVAMLWRSTVVVRRVELERERSVQAVKESEARFRSLAENATEAIVTIDEDDRVVFANPGTERMLGYAPHELVGHPFPVLIPERLRDRHRKALARYLRTGRKNISWDGIELPGLTRDGREVPLEVTFSEYTRDGHRYFTGIMRDVSERHTAQQRREFLLEAGRLFSGSLEPQEVLGRVAERAVPAVADWCAVDLLEPDGTLRRAATAHVDPARVEAVRLLVERYPPRPDADRGPPAVVRSGEPELYAEIGREDLAAMARDEEHARHIEALGLRSAMVVPMRGDGGVLGAITLVIAGSGRSYGEDDVAFALQLGSLAGIAVQNSRLHEATDEARHEAERRAREEGALREAASALSATFSTEEVVEQIARGALVAADADGAFVERIDGSRGEVEVVALAGGAVPALGARVPYAGSAAQRALERLEPELVERIGEGERPFEADFTRRHATSRALVLPLVEGAGPIGALVLVRDGARPDFRDDEVERARTFGDLAALAFRKAHILEESERRREELERVSESRARLMRGFSHDVKNPLGAVDGFAELFLEGMLGDISDKQRETLQRMRRGIRSALSLIDDLLELARTEAGQIEIRPAPTDLREALQELAEGYRPKAEAKGLEFVLDLPDVVPLVMSDPERVRQVLGNLISNAVKYTERGRVEVRTSVRDDWLVAEVGDTGAGIPEDRRELLFQEFSRLEPGQGEGAGLGLAIAQQVARALGGEIRLESEVGVGSTFSFWLPNDPVAREEDERARAATRR